MYSCERKKFNVLKSCRKIFEYEKLQVSGEVTTQTKVILKLLVKSFTE